MRARIASRSCSATSPSASSSSRNRLAWSRYSPKSTWPNWSHNSLARSYRPLMMPSRLSVSSRSPLAVSGSMMPRDSSPLTTDSTSRAREPGRAQELQHRGRPAAQHVPRDNGLATVDDAGDFIGRPPTSPWRTRLEPRQAEDTPDVARPVNVKRVRLWRRIELAQVADKRCLNFGRQLCKRPIRHFRKLPLELVPIPCHRCCRCSAVILFAALDELKDIDQRLKPLLVDLPSESVPRIVKLGRTIRDTRRRTALGDVNRIEDALQPLDAEHVLDSQPHRHVDGRGTFNVTGQ